jgi:hypothetical protein
LETHKIVCGRKQLTTSSTWNKLIPVLHSELAWSANE